MKRQISSSMKALTVWQPWASLVINNAKPFEFRGKSYRAYVTPPQPGDCIAIHAAARPARLREVDAILARIFAGEAPDLVTDRARALLEPLRTALRQRPGSGAYMARHVAPLGYILGTAIIGEPKRADEIFRRPPDDSDVVFNWAWPLTVVEVFAVPRPARGQQGFWKWTP